MGTSSYVYLEIINPFDNEWYCRTEKNAGLILDSLYYEIIKENVFKKIKWSEFVELKSSKYVYHIVDNFLLMGEDPGVIYYLELCKNIRLFMVMTC